jgi:ATP-dependent RNA helicase RhlE
MDTNPASLEDFVSTGLSSPIITALTQLKITKPTPIQAQAIPVARSGKDVMGIAETGTGKTYAFSLPILEKLATQPGKALIVVPTRELALQVEDAIRVVARTMQAGIRTVCLIGGMPMFRQVQDLRNNPRIIVCTPGRLRDHLQQRTVHLNDVHTVVLDEADRMLDMGFAPQIRAIMDSVPDNRQTMCFSATMAPEITRLAAAYLKDPVRIEVAKAGQSNENISQELCYVMSDEKNFVLETILKDHPGSVLVFTRTKHGAKKLTTYVQHLGHTAAEIHSNRSLGQRRHALSGFKSGQFRVLVATDVAARGIDVNDISLVVNYDLPEAAEDYVHRIGRTGRAGKAGKTIALATRAQMRDVKSIERLIGKQIPVSSYSTAKAPTEMPMGRPFREGGAPRPAYGSRPSYGARRPSSGGYGAKRPSYSRPSYADRAQSRPAYGDRAQAPREMSPEPAGAHTIGSAPIGFNGPRKAARFNRPARPNNNRRSYSR